MNFRAVHRVSVYLMLFFASIVLNVDSGDQNRLAPAYPILVALAGAAAFFTVDRHPALALKQGAANSIALASFALVLLEYFFDEGLLLLSLGHCFCYIELVLMFRPKRTQDDWLLFVAGLVQVVIGGVISQSDAVGFALGAWGLCALWVLALFTLLREFDRGHPAAGTVVTPAVDPATPYPGLIDGQFGLAALRVALITIVIGGFIFLVMPRRGSTGSGNTGDSPGKHLTGFDDEVTLGQLGEILENDSIVMTVESFDERTRKEIDIGMSERLFRGVGMARYERGRWRKMASRPSSFPAEPNYPPNVRLIRQQIKLEATDNPVLFAIRPLYWATSSNRPGPPEFNQADGSIRRPDSRPVSIEYVVVSADTDDPSTPQPGELFPNSRLAKELVSIPDDLKAQLRPIAEAQLEGVDRGDRRAVANRLQAYLRDSGRFGYTLSQDVQDRRIDPVADFLINRKEGHCEYFASALALMLRSVDVPARLVNGFKGGDWNDLLGVLNVRQKHAHSWCEVLLADLPERPSDFPRWMTLDPTPGTPRLESLSHVGGVSPNFRQISDSIRYVWAFFVVGFNYERQRKYLYEPLLNLWAEAQHGFRMMAGGLRSAFGWLFHFPDLSSFISVRGFAVTFVSLTLLTGLVRLGFFLAGRIRRALRGQRPEESALAAGVLFYRRLVGLLQEVGLERPPAETPREFARRAAGFLAGRHPGEASVADVPPLVVDAYYRIRFGEVELGPEVVRQIEARLDALDAKVHPAQA